MFSRLNDVIFIREQYKRSFVMGYMLLSFIGFQKVVAAPATEAVREHLSSSQAAITSSMTQATSTTTSTTKNPGVSEQHELEPVNDEQECWNLIPKRYQNNNGEVRYGCPSTSTTVPFFTMPCAVREDLGCKLIHADQVDDLGLEINNLPENTILVIKYSYKESLPKDTELYKELYRFPKLKPFSHFLAEVYRMDEANLERMAWSQEQFTYEAPLSRCIPFKTPSRLKKNSVLVGVVTDQNGNKFEGLTAFREENLVSVCNEMGLEYHRDSMISVGTEDGYIGLLNEASENNKEVLNVPDIGIVHISGFRFLPRVQELSMHPRFYLGVEKPYLKLNCFNGEVRVQNNDFLLRDNTSVSMECARKESDLFAEDNYKKYGRMNSNFMFVDNAVYGMKGYLNVGLNVVSDGFYVGHLAYDVADYKYKLTSIHQNKFYGEMEYALKISGFDPFFSKIHSIKYNTIAGNDKGDMQNGLFLAGSTVYAFEKSSHKGLSVFHTEGNCIQTEGSAFVVDGIQAFSMDGSTVTGRHLITHGCTLYDGDYCSLHDKKPPISLGSTGLNRVYIEDEDFLASHMYSGNIHFIRMDDTGAPCDFPEPCLRDDVSSTTQAPSVTAQKLLADFPENALQPFVSVENRPVNEVLPAVFEQLPPSSVIFSPHKPQQEAAATMIHIFQNLKEKVIEFFSLGEKP